MVYVVQQEEEEQQQEVERYHEGNGKKLKKFNLCCGQ
jgi:hypothetical protein